jgi:hypothetical protein
MTIEERKKELLELASKQSAELNQTIGAINEIDKLLKGIVYTDGPTAETK